MRMRGRNAFWPLAIVLAFCTPVPAHADNSGLEPYEEFGKHIRAAQEVTPEKSDVFGDQVSLYNGATEFDVTDFSIPGNDALPVAIGRRFTVDDRRKDPGYLSGFGDWDIEVPYVEAVVTTQNGWTLYGSTPSNRCSDTTDQLNTKVSSSVGLIPAPLEKVWDGNQLHIPGAGSQELLVNDQGKSPAYASRGTYKWVTKDNWKLSCIPTVSGMSGEGFVAVSPSGVTYTFNRALINTAPQILVETVTYNGSPVKIYADRLRIFLLATQVKDRFGNTVNYNYDASNHLTSITSSDGRSITLTWSGSNIASVSSALGTWTYGYGTDSSGRTVLTSDVESEAGRRPPSASLRGYSDSEQPGLLARLTTRLLPVIRRSGPRRHIDSPQPRCAFQESRSAIL